MFELDDVYFSGLKVTRKLCEEVYNINLPTVHESASRFRRKARQEATNKKRYGYVNPLHVGSPARTKRDETMREKYGVINFYALPDYQEYIKNKQGAQEYHKRKSERSKKCWAKKSALEKQAWIDNSFHKHFKENKNWSTLNSFSKQELDCADNLRNLGYNVVQQLHLGKYWYDIYIKDLNLIVEYNGDFWHANPKKYLSTDIIHHNLTAQNIWERDEIKLNFLKEQGYNCIVIWETEFLNINFKELWEKKLNEHFKDKINKEDINP